MKKLLFVAAAVLTAGLLPSFAQLGTSGGGLGPHLGGALSKLFEANPTFTGTMEIETAVPSNTDIVMSGKFNFDHGKSRFEINMSQVRGGGMPTNLLDQLKSMGMDVVVNIARPDLKVAYIVYPGLNSYASMPPVDASASTNLDDYQIAAAKLGQETVDGHDCVKSKVTVTDKDGGKHESTVWNATDLKSFPMQIVTTEDGQSATLRFRDLAFDKPAANSFEPPAGLTKYDSLQTMMQTEMMKKMGGGAGLPPAQH
jgi:hypothetical protein